jgi:hypothetical protein
VLGRIGVPRCVAAAAAIRSAVASAVPDGASTLRSWWYSMISAVSKNGAASSAKRIISTAEIAKFGAIRQWAGPSPNAERNASRSSSVNPVVPTTAWMPCIASHGSETRAESATVKSTTTSHAGVGERSELGAIGHTVPVGTGVVRVDRGDEREPSVGGDRRADLTAHPPTGPVHPDLDLLVRSRRRR